MRKHSRRNMRQGFRSAMVTLLVTSMLITPFQGVAYADEEETTAENITVKGSKITFDLSSADLRDAAKSAFENGSVYDPSERKVTSTDADTLAAYKSLTADGRALYEMDVLSDEDENLLSEKDAEIRVFIQKDPNVVETATESDIPETATASVVKKTVEVAKDGSEKELVLYPEGSMLDDLINAFDDTLLNKTEETTDTADAADAAYELTGHEKVTFMLENDGTDDTTLTFQLKLDDKKNLGTAIRVRSGEDVLDGIFTDLNGGTIVDDVAETILAGETTGAAETTTAPETETTVETTTAPETTTVETTTVETAGKEETTTPESSETETTISGETSAPETTTTETTTTETTTTETSTTETMPPAGAALPPADNTGNGTGKQQENIEKAEGSIGTAAENAKDETLLGKVGEAITDTLVNATIAAKRTLASISTKIPFLAIGTDGLEGTSENATVSNIPAGSEETSTTTVTEETTTAATDMDTDLQAERKQLLRDAKAAKEAIAAEIGTAKLLQYELDDLSANYYSAEIEGRYFVEAWPSEGAFGKDVQGLTLDIREMYKPEEIEANPDLKNNEKAGVLTDKQVAAMKDSGIYDSSQSIDIKFLNADGEEVEPNGSVRVRIQMLKDAIPEGVDPTAMTIHHLVEKQNSTDTEDKEIAKVEKVAAADPEAADTTGTIKAINEEGEELELADIQNDVTENSSDTDMQKPALTTQSDEIGLDELTETECSEKLDYNEKTIDNDVRAIVADVEVTSFSVITFGYIRTLPAGDHFINLDATTIAGTNVQPSNFTYVPEHEKSIVDNENGLYTLKLDIVGDSKPDPNGEKPDVDVIFVMDKSGSMRYDMSGKNDYGNNGFDSRSRMSMLKRVLLGNDYKGNSGVINAILGNTKINARIAVASYSGSMDNLDDANSHWNDSDTVLDFINNTQWNTSKSSYANTIYEIKAEGGTNCEAGLREATDLLSTSKTGRENAQRFVIFLSDGEPTFYYGDAQDYYHGYYNSWENDVPGNYVNQLTESREGITLGHGNKDNRLDIVRQESFQNHPICDWPANLKTSSTTDKMPYTSYYWYNNSHYSYNTSGICSERALLQADLITGLSGFYTVGISSDSSVGFLTDLKNEAHAPAPKKACYTATNANQLTAAFDEIANSIAGYVVNGVTIKDTLSDNVTFANENASDAKLVVYDSTGSSTSDAAVAEAAKCTISTTVSGKTISAEIKDLSGNAYTLADGFKYSLEFLVKPTQAAYDKYAVRGYTDSDGTNSGLFANDNNASTTDTSNVNVHYNIIPNTGSGSNPGTAGYGEKPVVEIQKMQLKVTKTVTGNMGDKNKDFTFKLTVKNQNNVDAVYVFDENKTTKLTPTTDGTYAFVLKNGESKTFTLPRGMNYAVAEIDGASGYTTSYTIQDGIAQNGTITQTESTGNINTTADTYKTYPLTTVAFTNNLDVTAPATGVNKNMTPFFFMIGGSVLLAGAFITRKREHDGI